MDLRPKLVSFEERQNRGEEEGRGKERRRGREREEEEKGSSSQDQKGMEPTLIMDSMRFCMDLWVCMMINLLKPRVLLEFHLNPKIMESKVGKTPYGTRWLWNPSFEDGFMVNCK